MSPTPEYYAEVTAQLSDILIRLGDRLGTQASATALDYLDHNELGLALETMADDLASRTVTITDSVRADMLGVAERMGINDRVCSALRFSPRESFKSGLSVGDRPQTDGFRLQYRVVGPGLAEALISASDAEAHLTVSYICNPLGALLSDTAAISEGRDSAEFDWLEEPGRFQWRLTALAGAEVHVEIRDFISSHRGDILFETIQHTGTFARSVLRCADQLLFEIGEEAYQQMWRRPFPMSELERLRIAYRQL